MQGCKFLCTQEHIAHNVLKKIKLLNIASYLDHGKTHQVNVWLYPNCSTIDAEVLHSSAPKTVNDEPECPSL